MSEEAAEVMCLHECVHANTLPPRGMPMGRSEVNLSASHAIVQDCGQLMEHDGTELNTFAYFTEVQFLCTFTFI